jgi:hypothetical protein
MPPRDDEHDQDEEGDGDEPAALDAEDEGRHPATLPGKASRVGDAIATKP